MTALTVVATALSALTAGLFFSFSTFTMGGLRRLPPRDGLVAMQGINRAAVASPTFLTVFLGGAAVAVVLGILAATRLAEPAAPWQLAGAALNVAGLLVTIGFHIPRNNALGLLDPDRADSATKWTEYARTWTLGNHVRTLTSLASTVAFAVALLLL